MLLIVSILSTDAGLQSFAGYPGWDQELGRKEGSRYLKGNDHGSKRGWRNFTCGEILSKSLLQKCESQDEINPLNRTWSHLANQLSD